MLNLDGQRKLNIVDDVRVLTQNKPQMTCLEAMDTLASYHSQIHTSAGVHTVI